MSGVTPLAPGVWGVVATPFAGSAHLIDEMSLARLAQHYEKVGATGLTVLGVFGEASRLSYVERRTVLQVVRDAVSLPIVVGVTSLATAPAIEEIEQAQSVTGDRLVGAMVQINSADVSTLQQHLSETYKTTQTGIVVQDYPMVSGVTIPTDRLLSVIQDTEGLVALKAENPPTCLAIGTFSGALPELPVFGGLGGIGLLDELALGAAGAMTGFAFPEGLLACIDSFKKGGYTMARDAFLPYLPLANFEQQPGIGLAIRKEGLRRRGLIADSSVRPPSPSMPKTLSDQLDRHLAASADGHEVRAS